MFTKSSHQATSLRRALATVIDAFQTRREPERLSNRHRREDFPEPPSVDALIAPLPALARAVAEHRRLTVGEHYRETLRDGHWTVHLWVETGRVQVKVMHDFLTCVGVRVIIGTFGGPSQSKQEWSGTTDSSGSARFGALASFPPVEADGGFILEVEHL